MPESIFDNVNGGFTNLGKICADMTGVSGGIGAVGQAAIQHVLDSDVMTSINEKVVGAALSGIHGAIPSSYLDDVTGVAGRLSEIGQAAIQHVLDSDVMTSINEKVVGAALSGIHGAILSSYLDDVTGVAGRLSEIGWSINQQVVDSGMLASVNGIVPHPMLDGFSQQISSFALHLGITNPFADMDFAGRMVDWNILNGINTIFADTMLHNLDQQLSDLARIGEQLELSFESLGREISCAAPSFVTAQLWLPVSSSFAFLRRLNNLQTRGVLTSDRVNDEILTLYQANDWQFLKEEVDQWQNIPAFERRGDAIRSALKAHLEGNYIASVLVLFVQAEGIIHELCGHRPGRHSTLHEKTRSRVKDMVPSMPSWEPVMRDAFNVLFEAMYEPRDYVDDRLNRNVILHGFDVAYGTKVNSLRLFMFLEMLHFIFTDKGHVN